MGEPGNYEKAAALATRERHTSGGKTYTAARPEVLALLAIADEVKALTAAVYRHPRVWEDVEGNRYEITGSVSSEVVG